MPHLLIMFIINSVTRFYFAVLIKHMDFKADEPIESLSGYIPFSSPSIIIIIIIIIINNKILVLNFRRVLIVVSFLLGKSPASVYYCMPTFRNSRFHLLRQW